MRNDTILPVAGNVGADGETWFQNHMTGHGYQLVGFGDRPDWDIDGMITDRDGVQWFVEVKTVSNPTTDSFTVAETFVDRYREYMGLIVAVAHPEWSSPRFIPWTVADRVKTGPHAASKRRGFGRYDYYRIRLAYATVCRECRSHA